MRKIIEYWTTWKDYLNIRKDSEMIRSAKSLDPERVKEKRVQQTYETGTMPTAGADDGDDDVLVTSFRLYWLTIL